MAVASTLIVVGSVGTLIFSVIMLGVSTGSIFPVSVALISDEVSKNHLGTAMGYF
jgi:MFS family permease